MAYVTCCFRKECVCVVGKPRIATFTTKDETVPDAEFVIVGYDAARLRLADLSAVPWDVVVVDEAARIKNRKAKRTKAVWKLAHKSDYLWLLSGTPVQNRPDELWSLLHAIDPRRWSSYWRFVERHCEVVHHFFGTRVGRIKDKNAFAAEVAPVMLRRTRELLNLPPLTEETIYVELADEQARVYDEMEANFVAALGDDYIVAPSILAQITRLRQIACSPALVGGADVSAKTEALLELLEDTAKVLVFTTFAGYVDLLLPRLSPYNPVVVTGGVSTKQRDEATRTFQTDDNCRVLIGTTEAMSEGLNLQAANVVVFLDLSWTPAAIDQAIGRACRRGQTKPVHVVKLVAAHTVDEDIAKLLARKRGVIRDVEAVTAIVRGTLERTKGGKD